MDSEECVVGLRDACRQLVAIHLPDELEMFPYIWDGLLTHAGPNLERAGQLTLTGRDAGGVRVLGVVGPGAAGDIDCVFLLAPILAAFNRTRTENGQGVTEQVIRQAIDEETKRMRVPTPIRVVQLKYAVPLLYEVLSLYVKDRAKLEDPTAKAHRRNTTDDEPVKSDGDSSFLWAEWKEASLHKPERKSVGSDRVSQLKNIASDQGFGLYIDETVSESQWYARGAPLQMECFHDPERFLLGAILLCLSSPRRILSITHIRTLVLGKNEDTKLGEVSDELRRQTVSDLNKVLNGSLLLDVIQNKRTRGGYEMLCPTYCWIRQEEKKSCLFPGWWSEDWESRDRDIRKELLRQ